MKTPEATPSRCPDCDAEIPPGQPKGLCFTCALKGALEATPFVPSSSVDAQSPASVTEQPGERIGRYKLLQKIGEGGCGVVYMAEQERPLRRCVALKVIKLGMDTKSVIARFEAERQALALMDHPNIAKVLDAGATDAGRPYFVMELVKGVRITHYCDEHKLTTRARLDLFTLVCHAIQHAHQKGIIHRDIKPSNVLVTLHDGVPVPKVIDFGIAKATDRRLTDKTVFTEFQAFMGTPAYMSPEQAEMSGLDIDTRSDIYALGVLLYELLTGKPPFDGKELLAMGLDEMRRTIREQEPVKPSTRVSTMLAADLTVVATRRQAPSAGLTSLLRGDLDWIVMKALEKDRTRRYDTANAFALDIRRFLADEPVSAAAPSAAYRFGKFARRNKAALGVAAAFAALLIAASVVSTWQAFRASRAEAMTQKRVLEVAAERDAKDKARLEAESISAFLTGVFRSPDPERDGRTITVAETLDRAAEKLETGLTTQPTRRAELQLTLGETYFALGLAREAISLQEKARDYYLANFGPDYPGTFKAMLGMANSYSSLGRWDEALKLREEVLRREAMSLGPEHLAMLGAVSSVANSYFETGRRDDALRLREQMLPLMRKALGPEDSETLKAMVNLGVSYAHAGRRDEALKLREETMLLLGKLRLEHPIRLTAMGNLAESYAYAGRWDEALKLQQEKLTLCVKVFGPDSVEAAESLDNIGVIRNKQGDLREAEKLFRAALAIHQKHPDRNPPAIAHTLLNFAVDSRDQRRFAEAEDLFRQAFAIQQSLYGTNHIEVADSLNAIAEMLQEQGKLAEAEAMQREAAAVAKRIPGADYSLVVAHLNNLGLFFFEVGKLADAEATYREVVNVLTNRFGHDHEKVASALGAVATVQEKQKKLVEVETTRRECLAIQQKVFGAEHAEVATALNNLGVALRDQGRVSEAEVLFREALAMRRKLLGNEDAAVARSLTILSSLIEAQGKLDDAEVMEREALAIRRKLSGAHQTNVVASLNHLGQLLRHQSKWAEAEATHREAIVLQKKLLGSKGPEVAHAMSNLIWVFNQQRKFAEAEPLMLEYLEILQKDRKADPMEQRAAIERLGRFYIDWSAEAPGTGKSLKALEWRKKLRQFDEAAQQGKPVLQAKEQTK